MQKKRTTCLCLCVCVCQKNDRWNDSGRIHKFKFPVSRQGSPHNSLPEFIIRFGTIYSMVSSPRICCFSRPRPASLTNCSIKSDSSWLIRSGPRLNFDSEWWATTIVCSSGCAAWWLFESIRELRGGILKRRLGVRWNISPPDSV